MTLPLSQANHSHITTMVGSSTLYVWLFLLLVVSIQGTIAANCPCGYLDPTTNSLWTDAIVTYFNETDAAGNIVTTPSVSPYYQGHLSAGDTGNGTQDWSIIGNQLNAYEDGFDATYRSGVQYNNTALRGSNLEMYVQPADRKNRIVYGAEFVTRRRDILYGSFRAAMASTFAVESGTAFQMSATYNTSETVDLGLFMADHSNDSTLQWSYSARDTNANPVKVPLDTLLNASAAGFFEHRFDWKSNSILFSNNNTNISASSLLVTPDDSHNIPSSPVPLSFRHYSNGDDTASEGPPLFTTQVGRIQYARFFFNSSLPSRQAEFVAQCAAAAASTATCDTEDYTLRGSTNFTEAATLYIKAPQYIRKTPKYSLIGMTISGGLMIILLLHGLIKNVILKQKMRQQAEPSQPIREDSFSSTEQSHGLELTSSTSSEETDSYSYEMGIDKPGLDTPSRSTSDLHQPSGRRSSCTVLDKWNAATLLRTQLEAEDAGSTIDEDSDDEDPMEDAQQEIDITNDDGLGRPDHYQFHGHLHSVPDSAAGLPRFEENNNAKEEHHRAPPRSYSSLSGYRAPSRNMSQPSLASLQEGGGGGVELEQGHIPSSWKMSPHGYPIHRTSHGTALGNYSTGPLGHRLGHDASFANLHDNLLNGEEDEEDETEEGKKASMDIKSLNRYSPALLKNSRPSNYSLSQDSQRNSITSASYLLKEKPSFSTRNELRRVSMSSMFSIATFNTAFPYNNYNTEAPPTISVWTRSADQDGLVEKGEKQQQQQGEEVLAARAQLAAAAANDTSTKLQVKKRKPWWKATFEYMFVLDTNSAMTASGAAKISYLEGLRGFACFLVSLNHFMLMYWYASTTLGAPTHTNGFEIWFYRIFSPIFFNQGTKIGIFFVLPARVMGTRYMLRGKLQDLADSTLRRIPRLAFPTFASVLINYFMIQNDAYVWVMRLPSRTWSTWAYFQDFDSIGSFINAWIGLWFTLPPQNPVLLTTYATGVLWTIPVITQSSFAVLITVIVSRELPNVYKRYAFYFAAMTLSWYANRFDYYFIAGLVIADMDNKLNYRQAAAKGIPIMPQILSHHLLPNRLQKLRIHGQIFGWILFLGGAVVQYLEYLRLPGQHFNRNEFALLPDFYTSLPQGVSSRQAGQPLIETYNDPRFSLFCNVIGVFILADLCSTFSGFFKLRWWSAIGRNGFSLYLLHGTIFWSWGAWLCILLLTHGVTYWAAITIVFITSYLILAVFCELFTRTFDAWGVSMSKAMWRYSSGGLGRRD